jgi:hypothetical protein
MAAVREAPSWSARTKSSSRQWSKLIRSGAALSAPTGGGTQHTERRRSSSLGSTPNGTAEPADRNSARSGDAVVISDVADNIHVDVDIHDASRFEWIRNRLTTRSARDQDAPPKETARRRYRSSWLQAGQIGLANPARAAIHVHDALDAGLARCLAYEPIRASSACRAGPPTRVGRRAALVVGTIRLGQTVDAHVRRQLAFLPRTVAIVEALDADPGRRVANARLAPAVVARFAGH